MTPTLTLNTGTVIPQIGFGTWRLDDAEAEAMVGHAIRSGYRLIDTASAYGNEAGVGRAVRTAEVAREEVFVTSKLGNKDHGFDATLSAFDATMERLGLEMLDLYLIHWPRPMANAYDATWRALVRLQSEGRVRDIGVSNFNADHLERIIGQTGVVPAVNQIELHPGFQQAAARALHDQLGIKMESWSPLGQGNVTSNPVLSGIAARLGCTASQVVLRWHLDMGLIVIPRSKSPAHIDQNLDVAGVALTDADLAAIAGMDDAGGRIGPNPSTFSGA